MGLDGRGVSKNKKTSQKCIFVGTQVRDDMAMFGLGSVRQHRANSREIKGMQSAGWWTD